MAYSELKYLSINSSMYQFQDIGARELISQLSGLGLVTTVATDAASTPYGVQWKDGGTTITGTWVADSGSLKYLVLVPDNLDGATGDYVEYVSVKTSSNPDAYAWEKIGTTASDLTDYTKKSYFTSGHITIGNAGAHSHALPVLTASFTPAGTISFSSADYTGTSATVTSATTAATVTGASYTPEGSITPTNTKTAADVTGASYTPAGTVSVTDTSHSHTLTSSTATATGRLQYVYGGSTTGGTAASLVTSTYSSVAYNVSVNGEVLVMDTAQMSPVSSWTANTPATASFSTAYMYTTSANTGISSGTFSGTAATITPTVSYSKTTAATFSGSAATITPGVSYIKVTGVTYDKTTGATFSGTAGTPTVGYSTTFSTATTSTAVGGAASGTYSVLDSNGGVAGVLSASYVPA